MSSPAPDDVGRVLSVLTDAGADTGDRSESRPPTVVVVGARDAFQSFPAAARFLSDGGELTLRRVVGEAARRGHHDCARRGRSLLADLDRLHAALADADAAKAPNRSSRATERRLRGAGHLRSGRTTVFSGSGKPSDR